MVQKKEVIAYIASIIYASIFGLSFLFSKRALEVAAPLQLISFRFLLAFMMLTLLVVLRVVKVDYRGKSLKDLVLLSIPNRYCILFLRPMGFSTLPRPMPA